MEDNSFILDNMRWSFSRLESFYNCPYSWKRHYIDCEEGQNNAFAEYGSLCHRLLEQYEKGEIDIFDISQEYESRFNEEVQQDFPPNKYVDLRDSYYSKGLAYFDNLDLDLDKYTTLGVEKEVTFEIYDKPFVGYIDLLLQDENGKIIVADHKSASFKLTKKNEVAKSSVEKMETYKKQLYLYSKPVIAEYGHVDYLWWNLFNEQTWYKIPFDQKEYEAALQWAEDTIKLIEQETEWNPNPDFYKCAFICDYRNYCEYKP